METNKTDSKEEKSENHVHNYLDDFKEGIQKLWGDTKQKLTDASKHLLYSPS
jgi:hypothetical protein